MACPSRLSQKHVIHFVEDAERRRGPELLARSCGRSAWQAHSWRRRCSRQWESRHDDASWRRRAAIRCRPRCRRAREKRCAAFRCRPAAGSASSARPPSARAVAMHSAGRSPLPDRSMKSFTSPIEVPLRLPVVGIAGRERVGQASRGTSRAAPGSPTGPTISPTTGTASTIIASAFEPRCIGRAGVTSRRGAKARLRPSTVAPGSMLERVRRRLTKGATLCSSGAPARAAATLRGWPGPRPA